MSNVKPESCVTHRWERLLETCDGVQCVVRVCGSCGRRELVWSRRGLPQERVAGGMGAKHGTIGRKQADS